jgi:predicted neuraminidase
MKFFLILFLVALTFPLFSQNIKIEHQRGFVKSEFIYSLNEKPTPECHASTLVETKHGILVAWFGGTEEGANDVGIWTSLNDGLVWSKPIQVINGKQEDGSQLPCWNPVLFQPSDGPLMLFYKVGPNPREWWGMLMVSADGGETWSKPSRLPDGILGPIKNKPIELPTGEIFCGSSDESDGWQVYFEITKDLGQTWKTIGPMNKKEKFDAIQPTLFLHVDKKDTAIVALSRTKQGCIAEVRTDNRNKNMGKRWTNMKCTKLPNPNSGIDGATLSDGRHILVYNHTEKGRSPLNVALSKNCKKWIPTLRLEDKAGEYSYPAVIQTSDGLIHITYTWKRQAIKHVVLNAADL